MGQIVQAVSEETAGFLRAWRSDKNLKLIDPFDHEVLASEIFTNYMPGCDGSVTMFQKDGKKLRIKVESNTIRVKTDGNDSWLVWFIIKK